MLNAVMNATSATGSDISVPAIVVNISRRLPRSSSARSPPRQGRDQDPGADDRHGQQHLEGRLRDELDGDDWPVGGGEQRAAFEQELEVQVALLIVCSL